MSGSGIVTFLVLLLLGFIGFVIYFIFKILQFVIVSVNLYKKMVNRQDAMIKLLIDIRDHTKQFKNTSIIDDANDDSEGSGGEYSNIDKADDGSEDPSGEYSKYVKYVCSECGAKVPVGQVCPKCESDSNITTTHDCICDECGGEVSLEDKKCPKCGAGLSESDGYVCSDCGGETKPGDKKCPKCGASFNE